MDAAGIVHSGPGLVKVMWDIENVHCKNPIALKRALESYLRERDLHRVGDRMEITAYHDPRRLGALSEAQADTLAIVPINLIDKGSKKGLADHCLARDCHNTAYDAAMLGLRVRCVVVISSDSDYSAAGVYDALNNVGIHLLVVHTSVIKRSLLDTESECRRFVHLEDLLRRLPVPPATLPGFSERGGLSAAGAGAGSDTMTGDSGNGATGSGVRFVCSSGRGAAAMAVPPAASRDGVLQRRESAVTLTETPPPQPAEEHVEAFRSAVVAALRHAGGRMLGSQLGATLRATFNYTQLGALLDAMGDLVRVIRPQGRPGDITVELLGVGDRVGSGSGSPIKRPRGEGTAASVSRPAAGDALSSPEPQASAGEGAEDEEAREAADGGAAAAERSGGSDDADTRLVAEDHFSAFADAVRAELAAEPAGPRLASQLGLALQPHFTYTSKLGTLLSRVAGVETVRCEGGVPQYHLSSDSRAGSPAVRGGAGGGASSGFHSPGPAYRAYEASGDFICM
jgi:hypothetical protein